MLKYQKTKVPNKNLPMNEDFVLEIILQRALGNGKRLYHQIGLATVMISEFIVSHYLTSDSEDF